MISDTPRSGSTPTEVFRAVFPGRTPDGDPNTLIVTRQGQGQAARVWLTFVGALRTTVALTDPEAEQAAKLLGAASKRKTLLASDLRRGRPRDGQGDGRPL
ncbi:MAG: hypothetical protein ACRDRX_01000 [Pseudonocardiaceae bacterium]